MSWGDLWSDDLHQDVAHLLASLVCYVLATGSLTAHSCWPTIRGVPPAWVLKKRRIG
jgi:hypothetical protein